MSKFGNIVLSVISLLVFSTLGISAHSTMVSSHTQHNSSHASQPLYCASLCISLPNGRLSEDELYAEDKGDDKYEEPDFRKLLVVVSDVNAHSSETSLAVKFEPPPGPPGYILHAVFRV